MVKVRYLARQADMRSKVEEVSVDADALAAVGTTLIFQDDAESVLLAIPEGSLIDVQAVPAQEDGNG